MGFEFETNGTSTYLVYKIQPKDVIDTMGLGMLTNNKILGLAPAIFTQLDTTKYIKYNVSSKVSARNFLTGAVNKRRLIGVFSGIVNAMLSAEDYMIDTKTILLDLDYIFADVSTCRTVLICLPVVNNEEVKVDYCNFFKNIVFTTQFDQTENCDYVAKIINYLNSTPAFSFSEFKEVLDSILTLGMTGTMSTEQLQQIALAQQQAKAKAEQREAAPVIQQTENAARVANERVDKVNNVVPNQQTNMTGNGYQKQNNVAKKADKNGMNIPDMPSHNQAQIEMAATSEKQITMFGLLAHYSKENAALYKAQKQQRKSNQAPQVNEKKSKKNHGKEMQPNGFVIPGQGQQIPQDINQNQNMQQVQVRENPVVINQQHKLEDNNLKVNKQIQQVQQVRQIQQPPYNAGAIGETTVLNTNPTGQTTVLGVDAMMPVMPYLVRKRNNERIDINKPVFRIGKEKSYVDYFIADNSAISRSHANIVTRENEYFLVDTNSTNHSYIDGKMIPSNQEVQIASGSVIKLANEEFEFHL